MEQLDKPIVMQWSVQHVFVQRAIILDQHVSNCCTCAIAVQHVHSALVQSSMLLSNR